MKNNAKIISALSLLLCVLMLLCGCGKADVTAQGYVGTIKWTLYDDGLLGLDGTGTVPGIEYTYDHVSMTDVAVYPDWYEYRDMVKSIVVGDGIEQIGMNAFVDFEALETVDVAASVRSIKGHAFSGCPMLARFTVYGKETRLEKYCIGYTAGNDDGVLANMTFVGVPDSDTERYAEENDARFKKLR